MQNSETTHAENSKPNKTNLKDNFFKLMQIDTSEIYDSQNANELINFKEEILSAMRVIENQITQSQQKQQEDLTNKLQNYDKKLEEQTYIVKEINKQNNSNNFKIDKINELVNFQKKANDQINSHEIKINTIQKDLNNACYKYDKIFVDNLVIPGTIGDYCKFKNLKEYIEYNIAQVSQLTTFKEKHTMDLKSYKEKLDILLRQMNMQLDATDQNLKIYVSKLLEQTEENYKKEIHEVGKKISDIRLENHKYAFNLQKSANDLQVEYNKILNIKSEIFYKMDLSVEILKNSFKDTQNEFDLTKNEFNDIKKKFNDLSEFIKDVRFRKNLGGEVSRQEIKKLSNHINFNKKKNKNNSNTNTNNEPYEYKNLNSISHINYNSNEIVAKQNLNHSLVEDNCEIESYIKKYINGEQDNNKVSRFNKSQPPIIRKRNASDDFCNNKIMEKVIRNRINKYDYEDDDENSVTINNNENNNFYQEYYEDENLIDQQYNNINLEDEINNINLIKHSSKENIINKVQNTQNQNKNNTINPVAINENKGEKINYKDLVKRINSEDQNIINKTNIDDLIIKTSRSNISANLNNYNNENANNKTNKSVIDKILTNSENGISTIQILENPLKLKNESNLNALNNNNKNNIAPIINKNEVKIVPNSAKMNSNFNNIYSTTNNTNKTKQNKSKQINLTTANIQNNAQNNNETSPNNDKNNIDFIKIISTSFTDFKKDIFKKLSLNERRILEMEHYSKKKLEELAQQIKNYIPINFNAYVKNLDTRKIKIDAENNTINTLNTAINIITENPIVNNTNYEKGGNVCVNIIDPFVILKNNKSSNNDFIFANSKKLGQLQKLKTLNHQKNSIYVRKGENNFTVKNLNVRSVSKDKKIIMNNNFDGINTEVSIDNEISSIENIKIIKKGK